LLRAALAASLAAALAGAMFSFGGRAGEPARAAGSAPAGVVHDEDLRLAVPSGGEWFAVEIHALVYDDGSGGYAVRAAEARSRLLARFPGAVLAEPGEVSAQFVQAGYWWPAHTVDWSYNDAGKPARLVNDDAVVAAAAATWNNAGADWRFTGGGPTPAATGGCEPGGRDGQNTVGWAAQGGSTLAITCTWYPQHGPGLDVASEFDMEIDPIWNWTTGNPAVTDLQSIVTHEFGHALGLGHAERSRCPGPIMCDSYSRGTIARTPQADDVAGLVALYGQAPVPAPTPQPVPAPLPAPAPGPYRAILPALSHD